MNNPNAFPDPLRGGHMLGLPCEPEQGMSLRDYFAAKAMQAFITSSEKFSKVRDNESCASESYGVADAMLAERAKAKP